MSLEDVEDHILLALAGHAFADTERLGELKQLDGVLALEFGEVDQAVVAACVGVLVVVDGVAVVVARVLVVAAAVAVSATTATRALLLVAFVPAPPAAAFAIVTVVAVITVVLLRVRVLAASLRLAGLVAPCGWPCWP